VASTHMLGLELLFLNNCIIEHRNIEYHNEKVRVASLGLEHGTGM